MSETVEIKLAEPENAAAILNFLRQAATESDAVTIPHLEKITAKEEFKNIQIINGVNDCIILLAVIVAKKYWHQGIGQLLVDEAEYWFVNYSSLVRLTLDVFEDNVPAINLYRKMNFVVREHRLVSGRKALQMDYRQE